MKQIFQRAVAEYNRSWDELSWEEKEHLEVELNEVDNGREN